MFQESTLKELELLFHYAVCGLLLLLRMLSRFQLSAEDSCADNVTHEERADESVDRNTDHDNCNHNSRTKLNETSMNCSTEDKFEAVNVTLNPCEAIKQHLHETRCLVNKLTAASMIIEQYPPQVLKTDAKFRASVRLAVGTAMGLHLIKPQVKCVLLNESQLVKFNSQGYLPNGELKEGEWHLPLEKERSGTLKNSAGNLDRFSGELITNIHIGMSSQCSEYIRVCFEIQEQTVLVCTVLARMDESPPFILFFL